MKSMDLHGFVYFVEIVVIGQRSSLLNCTAAL
jgi:hypothetical protein